MSFFLRTCWMWKMKQNLMRKKKKRRYQLIIIIIRIIWNPLSYWNVVAQIYFVPNWAAVVPKNSFEQSGEQGWCSGESARLPPMCPGFDSRTRRHMWAEFVGSLLCSERFFSGNSGFPLSSKTNIWFDLIWFIWFTVSPISTALVLG